MRSKKENEQTKPRLGTSAFIGLLIIGGAVVVTGAFFIGKSDSGQINVAATIQNSNQTNVDAGGDPNNMVGTVPEAFRNKPNGGLVPAENQEVSAPLDSVLEDAPTTEATTTDTEGSTTDEVRGEEEVVTPSAEENTQDAGQ